LPGGTSSSELVRIPNEARDAPGELLHVTKRDNHGGVAGDLGIAPHA